MCHCVRQCKLSCILFLCQEGLCGSLHTPHLLAPYFSVSQSVLFAVRTRSSKVILKLPDGAIDKY